MAALFDGSAAYMQNAAAPVVTYPFSVACWGLYVTAGTTVVLFGLTDTATATHYFTVYKDTANKINAVCADAGGGVAATVATAEVTGQWFFALARFISATNRRLSVLHADGKIEHAQSTTSRSPLSVDLASIGALKPSSGAQNFWPGLIGELWYTNTDIQPDGAQTDDNLVRQLAYGGPFSIQSVAADLVEYHAMRSRLPFRPLDSENYYGKFGPQVWTDQGTTLIGLHPPLPYNFARPRPVARMLTI